MPALCMTTMRFPAPDRCQQTRARVVSSDTSKVLKLRLLMPTSGVFSFKARPSRPVVHLYQHRHVQAAGNSLQARHLRRPGRRQSARWQSAPWRGFVDW